MKCNEMQLKEIKRGKFIMCEQRAKQRKRGWGGTWPSGQRSRSASKLEVAGSNSSGAVNRLVVLKGSNKVGK
jgi:hypothetical protein